MKRFQTMVCPTLFIAAALAASPAAAQDLKFETTVDFAFVKRQALEGTAGEVEIRGVEFVSSSGSGGFMKKTFSSDLQAGIGTRIECSTTAETKWKLKMTVEFLDAEGNVIDRARNDASLKKEAKIVEFGHATLKWAVQHIEQARIIIEASGKN
jgi:hypothetical protein